MSYYMSWNKDPAVVLKSSSGGIFTALAEYVLSKSGVVFGVKKGQDCTYTATSYIENKKQIDDFRRSKYYQSRIGNSYEEVRSFLKEKRWVLYSGTPCQIAGLLSYLKQSGISAELFKHLITVDVFCHGVSNEAIFKKYLGSMEKHRRKSIKRIDFRTKKVPWQRSSSVDIQYSDGTTSVDFWTNDTFYIGFNRNAILRPSCYKCPFASSNRISDFSIGDFWGVNAEDVEPEILKNGVGVTIVNTDKANNIWKYLNESGAVYSEEISYSYASKRNGAIKHPAWMNSKRKKLLQELQTGDYINSVYKVLMIDIVKIRLKRILKRL